MVVGLLNWMKTLSPKLYEPLYEPILPETEQYIKKMSFVNFVLEAENTELSAHICLVSGEGPVYVKIQGTHGKASA